MNKTKNSSVNLFSFGSSDLLHSWADCLFRGLFFFLCLALGAIGSHFLSAQDQGQMRKYKIVDVYITGLDKLSEESIQRYVKENGIRLGASRSRKQLNAAARRLAKAADGDSMLLAFDLSFDYVDKGETGPEVYIEVLVSEMSIQFIPGGGNAYARLGWANRIERNGRPSLIWLALGYNRQDVEVQLPYLWGSPLGFDLQAGHEIKEQWDFAKTSTIHSNLSVVPELYLQPLTWLKVGAGLDAGLLYFYMGKNPGTLEIGGNLGLGPELRRKNIPGKIHGRMAVLGNLELDQDYLASMGLGYHLRFQSRHELLGLYAGNNAFRVEFGLVHEPVDWFRPSIEFRGEWREEGLLPLKSEVFSSNYQGYILGAGELRLLFTPLHIEVPMNVDIGLNVGAIVGFTNVSSNFHQIDLNRDLELNIFAGPELYFGMPVNVRGQFDFGIIFRKQFQEIGFAFNIRVL